MPCSMAARSSMMLLGILLLHLGFSDAIKCYSCAFLDGDEPAGDRPCPEGSKALDDVEDCSSMYCFFHYKVYAYHNQRISTRGCEKQQWQRDIVCEHSGSPETDETWYCQCGTDNCNGWDIPALKKAVEDGPPTTTTTTTTTPPPPTPVPSPLRTGTTITIDCFYCASNYSDNPIAPMMPGCWDGGQGLAQQTRYYDGRCGVPGEYCQMNAKFFYNTTLHPLVERFCVKGTDPTCTIDHHDDGFLMGCGCEGRLCNSWNATTLRAMAEAYRGPALNLTATVFTTSTASTPSSIAISLLLGFISVFG